MLKKTLFAAAVALVASTTAMAEGFYVGAGAGAIDLNNKVTVTSNDGTGNTSSNYQAGKIGLNGVLTVGYAWDLANGYVLGLEAFGGAATPKDSLTITDYDTGNASTSLKLRYNYGARVLPGYQITSNTIGYGILGYTRADMKVNISGVGNTDLQSLNSTQRFSGYQVGFGAKTNVTRNIDIRGDVIYTGYSSKTFNFSNTNGNGTGTENQKLQPCSLEGDLFVVYKFG
jgi:outer membrane immunogenic protein